jgi:tetratricopeptide (TPR) repeat protein
MTHPEARSCRAIPVAFLAVASVLATCGTIRAEYMDEKLKQGIDHDVKLEARQALDCFLEVEKQQPKNVDVLVRIARQYRHLMADASSESDKLKLASAAVDYGRKAVAADPRNSEAQLSCAISYGKMLPMMSKKEQVASSKLIKEGAEKAIKLDSKNDLAWNILGRWHRLVAGMGTITRTLAAVIYDKLPDASNEDSVDCLEKAIKLNPNRLMHYIELGKTYAQMGKNAEAKRFLEKGLSMPCVDKDDPTLKEVARQTLASLR